MSRRVLISGSVAYDTIMVFEGRFRDQILPDRVHMLNVAFLTPKLKREFGGCAANIAYNMRALGGEPVILATVGQDGDDYLARLRGLDIDISQVRRLPDSYTAQAFITTDLDDNQIIAFHPGAMSYAHEVDARAAGAAALGIVAPNGKDAMKEHARAFHAAGIPFVFDPGQGLPMFDGEELREFIDLATAVVVNDYESKMLAERTGWSENDIARQVDAMIITRGGEGSTLFQNGQVMPIAPVKADPVVDPTGCGDAYRGGLLYGLAQGWSWEKSARLGGVLGAIKIEHQGGQNHRISRQSVGERFQRSYGESL